MKNKLDLEYIINSSPKMLFTRLSTPGGLSEWFADDVNQQGNIFTFIWDGSEEKAEVVMKKENKLIRFNWLEEENKTNYFEFRISIDELTGDVALLITDFAEEDEKDDTVGLWDSQISALKHAIGL